MRAQISWPNPLAEVPPSPVASREDWLLARTKGIGGSDVAGILGLSKWKTPLQVYQEKRGEIGPQPDNEAMKWGRYLEPVVRQAYADTTGREVRVPTEMLRHPELAFMLANVDGLTEDRRVVEVKTARTAEGWGEPGSDEIPQAYLLQVQHYMKVTAFPVADVAVLIGGSDFRLYEVPADPELQDMLVEAESEFWQRVVDANPPDPMTYADVLARFGRSSRAQSVVAGTAAADACAKLREIKEQREALDMLEEGARLHITKLLGEADTLVDAGGKVLATWKVQAGAKRLDGTALKVAHPAIYEQFVKVGDPCRRLLLK